MRNPPYSEDGRAGDPSPRSAPHTLTPPPGRRRLWMTAQRDVVLTDRPPCAKKRLIQVERIHQRLVVFLRTLHRFLEALIENAGPILLAFELFLEALRGLRLLGLEVRHHR